MKAVVFVCVYFCAALACDQTKPPGNNFESTLNGWIDAAGGDIVICLDEGVHTDCGNGVSLVTGGGGRVTVIGTGGTVTVDCQGVGHAFKMDTAPASGSSSLSYMAIHNCAASLTGSAVNVTAGDLSLSRVSFEGNAGTAVYTHGAQLTVTDSNFTGNGAMTNNSVGGAVFASSDSTTTIERCNFFNNIASEGGAVHMGLGSVADCVFHSNTAVTSSGGGIFSSQTVDVSDSIFIRNTAADSGGGCYVASLSNCYFEANSAEFGGGVFAGNQVINSRFYKNKAGKGGSAIRSVQNADGCHFERNYAGESGTVTLGDGAISNSLFEENVCGVGPASAVEANNIQMTNVTIRYNYAGSNAGNIGSAVYIGGNAQLTNTSIRCNAGTRVGGLYAIDNVSNATVDIGNAEFANNFLVYPGGSLVDTANNSLLDINWSPSATVTTASGAEPPRISPLSTSPSNCTTTFTVIQRTHTPPTSSSTSSSSSTSTSSSTSSSSSTSTSSSSSISTSNDSSSSTTSSSPTTTSSSTSFSTSFSPTSSTKMMTTMMTTMMSGTTTTFNFFTQELNTTFSPTSDEEPEKREDSSAVSACPVAVVSVGLAVVVAAVV